MLTITKRFGPYPAAHRQPKHEGHCAKIHGHDLCFEIEFSASKLDKCGFVLDFGGETMKGIKQMLEELFDHTFLCNVDDHELINFFKHAPSLVNLKTVPDCSAEGLASLLYGLVDNHLFQEMRDVKITRITVFEDSKNSATFYGN
jgi:6-pyruvoyltetrahydropterin/6-carboxytetrahydropterin synthase